MNVYYIVVDTGLSGYKIGNIIKAYTEEEAKEKAVKLVKEEILYMMRNLKVLSVEPVGRW